MIAPAKVPQEMIVASFHHWLESRETAKALSRTASSVFGIVAATLAAGDRELALVAAQEELVRPSNVFESIAI